MADLRVDSSEKWDDAIIAEVRAFIDASIFDRAPLHASLERSHEVGLRALQE